MKTKPRSIIRKRRRSPSRSAPNHQPAKRIPRKWRWHYRVLESLRDHLLDERAVALAEAAEPIERHSMDPADSATDEYDHALAATLLTGEQNALYELEAARRRIVAGTYGICEKTGKHIPPERLRAVPWTRFTKDAEAAFEKSGEIRPVGLAPAATIQGSGIGRFRAGRRTGDGGIAGAYRETASTCGEPRSNRTRRTGRAGAGTCQASEAQEDSVGENPPEK